MIFFLKKLSMANGKKLFRFYSQQKARQKNNLSITIHFTVNANEIYRFRIYGNKETNTFRIYGNKETDSI